MNESLKLKVLKRRSSLVAQWVKDPVLSLQWLESPLRGSTPGPGISTNHWHGQKNKIIKEKINLVTNFCIAKKKKKIHN